MSELTNTNPFLWGLLVNPKEEFPDQPLILILRLILESFDRLQLFFPQIMKVCFGMFWQYSLCIRDCGFPMLD